MKKNSWALLFQFLFIWILISSLCYLIIVVPFYFEELFISRKQFDLMLAKDRLFLMLTESSNLLSAITSFWVMKKKIEGGSIEKVMEFNQNHFYRGVSVGLLVMLPCILFLLIFKFVTFVFFDIHNLVIQVLFFLMVAISEEVIFRGFVLTNFTNRMSTRSAILISSLIFSLAHIANPNFGWIGFLNIFLSGVLMSILYLKNNNLSYPVGLHFSWNLFQNLLGFPVSGQKLDGLLSVQYLSTKTAITGGEFGLEGSLLLVPITLGFILLLWNKELLIQTYNQF